MHNFNFHVFRWHFVSDTKMKNSDYDKVLTFIHAMFFAIAHDARYLTKRTEFTKFPNELAHFFQEDSREIKFASKRLLQL